MIQWSEIPSLINPIVFSIDSFSLRWYSLSYLAAILTIYSLSYWRAKKEPEKFKSIFKDDDPTLVLNNLTIISLIGLFIGARLGYVLFYNFAFFLENPLTIIWPFENGEFTGLYGFSFHGGLAGILFSGLAYCYKKKISFLKATGFIFPAVPLGYFWGRLGNFMNGELYGRETSSPIGMHFPTDQQNLLRHPSQLYEALGEGLIIFAILWPLRNNKKFQNKSLALFLILYGIIRFLIEFVREPDSQLGKLPLDLTMGQILCLLMISIGIYLFTTSFSISIPIKKRRTCKK